MNNYLDDYMYNNGGINPYHLYEIYGKGGLGYKPRDYMIGGTVFTYNDKGEIIDARPYNEDDKEKIIKQGTVDYDLEQLQEHIKYFSDNAKSLTNEEKEQVLKDMNFLYSVNDKTLNGLLGLSNVIIKEEKEDVFIDKMIKETENEIEMNKAKKLELPSSLHKMIDDKIINLNDSLELLKKQKDNSRKPIKATANEITKLLTDEQIAELPKKEYYDYMNRLYLKSKNTKGLTDEQKDIIDMENKKLKKVIRTLKKEHKIKEIEEPEENKYITKGEFNAVVKPAGGGEAVENVIIENEDIRNEIYNKLKLSTDNANLMSLQDFLDVIDKSLPIDLIDPTIKILMEIKKYQKYDYQKFMEELFNKELPTLKKLFLEDLLTIPKVEPSEKIRNFQSMYNYNKKKDILRNFTDDKGNIDDEKLKTYLHKNYKGVSIPLGIQKFGNINEDEVDKSISKNDIQNALKSMNKDWNIKIDYNPESENYGKVIELNKKNGQYKEETKKIKNYDLVFTIALADELLTFNYSKYVRDKNILSPLNAFNLGNDFYEKDEKLSFMIPLELFERTEKTKYVEPKIKNEKEFTSIINDILLEDNKDEDVFFKNKLNTDYPKFLKNIKKINNKYEEEGKIILKFFKDLDITCNLENIKSMTTKINKDFKNRTYKNKTYDTLKESREEVIKDYNIMIEVYKELEKNKDNMIKSLYLKQKK